MPALSNGVGAASEAERYTRETNVVTPLKNARQLKIDGYGLDCGADSLLIPGESLLIPEARVDREVTVKVCGVAVTMPQGQSWVPTLPNG